MGPAPNGGLPVRLTSSLVTFLESGVAVLVGTCDDANVPDVAHAMGLRWEAASARLTVFLPLPRGAAQEPPWRRHLDQGRIVAIVASRPGDYRSVQVKGRVTQVAVAESARDRAFVEAYRDLFAVHLGEVGLPRHLANRMTAWPCLALVVEVAEVFDQTPGPGAGARVAEP